MVSPRSRGALLGQKATATASGCRRPQRSSSQNIIEGKGFLTESSVSTDTMELRAMTDKVLAEGPD